MRFEITYNQEHNFLMGKFIGDLNSENAKVYMNEIERAAKKHDCKRFINDLREATILLSIGDFYNAPARMATGAFGRSWRRAIVVKQKLDKLDFFETTSANQGFYVKVFEDMDEALKWL